MGINDFIVSCLLRRLMLEIRCVFCVHIGMINI
jgi:hypothetical protein